MPNTFIVVKKRRITFVLSDAIHSAARENVHILTSTVFTSKDRAYDAMKMVTAARVSANVLGLVTVAAVALVL